MSEQELMQEALEWQKHINLLAQDHACEELYQKRAKVFELSIQQVGKVQKYREALEFYADVDNYTKDKKVYGYGIFLDKGQKARQALKEVNNI